MALWSQGQGFHTATWKDILDCECLSLQLDESTEETQPSSAVLLGWCLPTWMQSRSWWQCCPWTWFMCYLFCEDAEVDSLASNTVSPELVWSEGWNFASKSWHLAEVQGSWTDTSGKGTPTWGNVLPPWLHYLVPLIYESQPFLTWRL